MVTSFFLRHKNIVWFIWLLLILGAFSAIAWRLFSTEPLIDNSVGIWFMDNDPELTVYDKFNKEFGEKEWSMLLVKTDSIYSPAFLRDLSQISKRIGKLNHIDKVISIANVRDSKVTAEGSLEYLQIYPAKDSSELLSEDQVKEFRSKLLDNPILENSIVHMSDSHHTVILFQNDNLIHDPAPYRIQLMDSIRSILKEYPSVKDYSLAGTTILNAELNRSSQHDVIVFYIMVTLFMVGVGYFLLRNLKDLFVMLSVVTTSVIVPMATLSLLKIPFNMVTVMLPPILITLSVCDVIHVINGYHLERNEHQPADAIIQTIHKIWTPCLWTTMITIIGFLSLLSSSVYPIWQLGAYLALGIFTAWLVTMSLVPVMLVFFWPAHKQATSKELDGSKAVGLYSKKLLPLLQGRNRLLWLFVAFMLMIPLFGLSKLDVDTDYTNFFGKTKDITKSYAEIKNAGYGQNPISIVLHYPAGKTISSEGYFNKMIQFEDALKKDQTIIKILSATALIDRMDLAFNGSGNGSSRIQNYSQDKISQLLFLGELAGNDDLKDFINTDKNKIQIIAMTSYMSSKELQKFKNNIYTLGENILPPDVRVEITGTTVLWANMDKQVSETMLDSLYIITIVFVVLMPIIFKSFKLGIIGVLINSLPLAIIFGVMGILNIKINLATAIIGGVAIGSTVDSTLFFINRFRLGLEKGMTWDESVNYAVVTVGDGMIMTSLIIAGGFACMMTSEFLPTRNFGGLVTVCMLIALFLDIVINPIIIKLINPQKQGENKLTPGVETL